MYSNWRVIELKEELKKRGASLRGRKSDLIERLELYDKNFNFGRPENVDDEDHRLQLPLSETYRDINSNTILPSLDKTMIRHYLLYTQKKMDIAIQLYETHHLLTARSSIVGDHTFIKGYCRKTMKNLQYEVDIVLSKGGNPEASHCECPAGSGINAVCKHVAVLLLAVENMVREKVILLQEVCTQKLQQFHVPKKLYMGTPVKAEKFNRIKSKKHLLFDPHPLKNVNIENYNARFRNIIINFSKSSMPLKQLYEPANPYALHRDHKYTQINPEENLLTDLKLMNVSIATIHEIQGTTIGQHESLEWHNYRKVRLTASNFHTLCHLKLATMKKYAREILIKKTFISRATSHGLLNEKVALNKYAMQYDLSIEPCGLFISPERPYLAGSPDGLLGSETIIEVKCPYASRFQEITPTNIPFLEEVNNTLVLKKSSPYYYQVQGQLYCSGKIYCNMIVYTYKDIKVIYIEKDNYFINSMLTKLDLFFHNYFKGALFEKYIYYDYENLKK